jgi:hypothetical protein
MAAATVTAKKSNAITIFSFHSASAETTTATAAAVATTAFRAIDGPSGATSGCDLTRRL